MRTTVRNSYTPKTGEYCNTIVVDEDNGAQYIFDSDGVFTTYTSKQQEGAPMGYVNTKMNEAIFKSENYTDEQAADVLEQAKAYTDAHSGEGGVSQEYVDQQDALILQQAKDYTDTHSGTGDVTQAYVDQQDAATLTAAKNYADTQDGALHNIITGEITSAINDLHSTVTSEIAAGDFATITVTTVDPGEGSPLAANHFIAVVSGEEESE